MPNSVYNTLRIYGPKTEIERFLYHVITEDSDRWVRPERLHIEKIRERRKGVLIDEHSIKILFETAWKPPLPVIKEASKQFPDLLFYLDFTVEDGDSGGLYRARNGWDAYADTSKIARWEFDHGTVWKFQDGRVVRPFDMKRPDIE